MQKLIYGFDIRHRFSFRHSPAELYDRAVVRLSDIPPPWGLRGVRIKPLPDAKKNPSTGVSYTRELGAPIKIFGLGFINRQLRAEPNDDPLYDDKLMADINIDHKLIDYAYLVRNVFPLYVEAMDAYFASLDAEMYGPANKPNHPWVNCRDGVHVIWPANFWDRELCRRAFSLTPEQVVARLQGSVAEARVFRDGALVIYSYERVPDENLVRIEQELRPLLSR